MYDFMFDFKLLNNYSSILKPTSGNTEQACTTISQPYELKSCSYLFKYFEFQNFNCATRYQS